MKLLHIGVIVITLLVWNPTSKAQYAALPEVGANLMKSYAGGDFDHVELQNGNLYVKIPLASFPQLGKLGLSFSLVVNGTPWGVSGDCDSIGDCIISYVPGVFPTTAQGSAGKCTTDTAGADTFGVTLQMDQSLAWCQMANDYENIQPVEAPDVYGKESNLWFTYGLFDSSGAYHAMSFDASNPTFVHDIDGLGYSLQLPPGMVTYGLQVLPSDEYAVTLLEPNGTKHTAIPIYDSGGNQLPNGTAFTDTNGNKIKYTGNEYDDSAGRIIPEFNSTQVPASTGSCPASPWPEEPVVSAYQWKVPGPNGQSNTYIFCYSQINIATNFIGNGPGSTVDGSGAPVWDPANQLWYDPYLLEEETSEPNVPVLQSVVLPNGTFWAFRYDTTTPTTPASYGDITDIITPSGGSIHYDNTTIRICGIGPRGNDYPPLTRAVTTRTVSFLTGPQVAQRYSYAPTATTVSDAAIGGNDTVHQYTLDYPNEPAMCGASETATRWYQGPQSANVLLREKDTSYETAQAPPLSTWPAPSVGITAVTNQFSNRRPASDVTTEAGVVTSRHSYGYDSWFSGVQPWANYANGTTKVQAPLPLSSIALATPTSVDDGIKTVITHRYASDHPDYAAANLVELPGTVTVTDDSTSTSSPVIQTTYTYDGVNSSGTRGNATAISKALGNASVSTTAAFNLQGMPTDTFDANLNAGLTNGNHVHITYDATGIFPSAVQQSATGTVAHTEYYSYDPVTGFPGWYTDQNGSRPDDENHTTSYAYDKMGRVISVLDPPTAAGRGGATYCYVDFGQPSSCIGSTPNAIYVTTKASPSPDVTKAYVNDGMGRPIQTQLLLDSAGTIFTDTSYDERGHVAAISSPYHEKTDHTYNQTLFGYDVLGRKTAAQHQADGTSATWKYAGNVVDVYDESGRHMQRTTDALGRLVRVVEPDPLSGALNSETDYTYDASDNLRCVDQWGSATIGSRCSSSLARRFSYDALSRLVTSANPETGTICYGQWDGGICHGGYDANGNLLFKTDARGILTSYTYDALNRILAKHSAGTQANAHGLSSCFLYDANGSSPITNAIGRLTAEWTQIAACTQGVTALPVSGVLSSKTITGYDALGRSLTEQTCTLNSCATKHSQSYAYDLAGNMTEYTDGLGANTFTQSYDTAGRLVGLTSSISDYQTYSALRNTAQLVGPEQRWGLGADRFRDPL